MAHGLPFVPTRQNPFLTVPPCPFKEDNERACHERRVTAYPDREIPTRNPLRRLSMPVMEIPEVLIPGTQKTTGPRGRTFSQFDSPLLQLPGELRNMVYDELTGGYIYLIVINEAAKRLGHMRCTFCPPGPCTLQRYGDKFAPECLAGRINSAGMWCNAGRTDGDLMPLLLSCRQIYTEFIRYIYMENMFSFADLYTFRLFHKYTIRHHVQAIRNLELRQSYRWPKAAPFGCQAICQHCPSGHMIDINRSPRDKASWFKAWEIVAGMPHLDFLVVDILWDFWIVEFQLPRTGEQWRILGRYMEAILPREKEFLEPLNTVRTKDLFVLFLNWPRKVTYEDPPPYVRQYRPRQRLI